MRNSIITLSAILLLAGFSADTHAGLINIEKLNLIAGTNEITLSDEEELDIINAIFESKNQVVDAVLRMLQQTAPRSTWLGAQVAVDYTVSPECTSNPGSCDFGSLDTYSSFAVTATRVPEPSTLGLLGIGLLGLALTRRKAG